MVELEVVFSSPEKPEEIQIADFKKYLEIIRQLGLPNFPKKATTVGLIFVDDRKIQELNRGYRWKDMPADLPSFALFESELPLDLQIFGEIYISLPTAKKQARERGHTRQEELNTLFVHGVLHLLGYDHENDTDFQI